MYYQCCGHSHTEIAACSESGYADYFKISGIFVNDCCSLPPVKDYLIQSARKKLAVIKRASPLVCKVIAEYDKVKDIKENASILDVLSD